MTLRRHYTVQVTCLIRSRRETCEVWQQSGKMEQRHLDRLRARDGQHTNIARSAADIHSYANLTGVSSYKALISFSNKIFYNLEKNAIFFDTE